jgi:1,3-beta-galactosyl-N-acetylhexosamine phosphorylase
MTNKKGRLTIPTDIDIVPQTLELMDKWGADAVRDCDGTEFPIELRDTGAKVYKTYYTTRKDNAWAKANPEEVQQCYIMTGFYVARGNTLSIPLMQGVSEDMMKVNERDNPKRWWEVIDRTEGSVVNTEHWNYQNGSVTIANAKPYHEYTVSFLAYLIWDPVHMYNAIVNDWQGVERQITFDVRQPKTHAYSLKRLDDFLEQNPYVDVVRFTTFFHQFTLVFDALHREKYVDWYGYSASVSPYILEKFEKEVGYPFRAEYIIDQGYYNNQYRVPSKEYKDFMNFQMREVASLAKELVDIVHKHGKEAMMFLGDHFIGTEPFREEFAKIGLDAVVGSVGNGSTLRLISDIPNVKYTEGRLLPYFFPDTFYEGGDPVKEAKENWVTARRAILRKPVDRIGYGGYLKLALQFPEFVEYVENVADEFRSLYEKIASSKPYSLKKVAVLNCWGKIRSWGCHMVHHALYKKENYSYALIECTNDKGKVVMRAEVQVGPVPEPPENISQGIKAAIYEWQAAANEPFPRFNKFTKWYNPDAYKGFGWCGAFVGYNLENAGVPMTKEFRKKDAPPLKDGSPFAVRQASQTKLFEGFLNRDRLSSIPRAGYYIIYGRKGSTPYTHIGLVTSATSLGDGRFVLETVEGNLNSRIRRYNYIYNALANKKSNNITSLPESERTQGDIFMYDYVDNFYINCFGQTWY